MLSWNRLIKLLRNYIISNKTIQNTLIYKPKQVASATVTPNSFPIIFANGQVYQVQGQYAIPLPPHEVNK